MSRRIHQFVDLAPQRACPRGCVLDQHAPACADTQCSGCLPRPCIPGRWLPLRHLPRREHRHPTPATNP